MSYIAVIKALRMHGVTKMFRSVGVVFKNILHYCSFVIFLPVVAHPPTLKTGKRGESAVNVTLCKKFHEKQ